jgi:hypothetical protein
MVWTYFHIESTTANTILLTYIKFCKHIAKGQNILLRILSLLENQAFVRADFFICIGYFCTWYKMVTLVPGGEGEPCRTSHEGPFIPGES